MRDENQHKAIGHLDKYTTNVSMGALGPGNSLSNKQSPGMTLDGGLTMVEGMAELLLQRTDALEKTLYPILAYAGAVNPEQGNIDPPPHSPIEERLHRLHKQLSVVVALIDDIHSRTRV